MDTSFGADRISDLPPFILHKIMWCLPIKESARISVLSKYWNSSHKSFPVLKFDTQVIKYINVVNSSLTLFVENDLLIHTFDVSVVADLPSRPLIDTWIPLALRRGASELTFRLHVGDLPSRPLIDTWIRLAPRRGASELTFHDDDPRDNAYLLPQTAFSLDAPSKFLNLQKLSLCNVVVSERIVRDLTHNCPNIAHLALAGIHGIKSLEISGLHKLESFIIESSTEIETILVDAPSLKSFVGSRVCPIDLRSCSALSSFKLSRCLLTDRELHDLLRRFPLLELLELSYCHNLKRVWTDLPRMQFLEVSHCRGVRNIHIESPRKRQSFRLLGPQNYSLTRNVNNFSH